jgi:hypothetical protein
LNAPLLFVVAFSLSLSLSSFCKKKHHHHHLIKGEKKTLFLFSVFGGRRGVSRRRRRLEDKKREMVCWSSIYKLMRFLSLTTIRMVFKEEKKREEFLKEDETVI